METLNEIPTPDLGKRAEMKVSGTEYSPLARDLAQKWRAAQQDDIEPAGLARGEGLEGKRQNLELARRKAGYESALRLYVDADLSLPSALKLAGIADEF